LWLILSVQRQAAEYILAAYPDVQEHMTADEYLDGRNEMQQALFKKVPPMAGAVHLVQSLVSELDLFRPFAVGHS
jgi:pseudouridine-5'-monophosphatase